ncbi:MAG: transposase [Solobacterium sp.]|nr:transposase [Solobacterium sp.]MBR0343093.1 transposase [Oscillospiraceae bacterium]
MFTMDQVHTIRDLYYNQGLSLTDIAKKLNCDWRTVRKYVDQEDFSPPEPVPKGKIQHESKLDPFKPLIDKWLIGDTEKRTPRKQRHTAKQIHKRLKKEVPGYNCSYRLTAEYVSAKKKELRLKKTDSYIPLIHRPGEGQADFGFSAFYENGKFHEKGKYLVLSFPYSNGAYLQLNYGENTECLLEGLQAMPFRISLYSGNLSVSISLVVFLCQKALAILTHTFHFQNRVVFKKEQIKTILEA